MRLVRYTPACVAWGKLDRMWVWCLGCGSRIRISDSTADLDGPAFKAYYCDDCASSRMQVRS